MLRGNVLRLSPDSLPQAGKSLLRQGFMTEDLKGYWLSKDGLLDAICDSGFGPFGQAELDDIPEDFWSMLGLDPEAEARIKEHVESGGEVEWHW